MKVGQDMQKTHLKEGQDRVWFVIRSASRCPSALRSSPKSRAAPLVAPKVRKHVETSIQEPSDENLGKNIKALKEIHEII